MQRYRLLLLAFVLLFGQIALIFHLSLDHDNGSGSLCELCVTASHQDHAITSGRIIIAQLASYAEILVSCQHGISLVQQYSYSVRAPPQTL